MKAVAVCVADEAAVAELDRARCRRLLAEEKQRLIAADRAFWADPDAPRPLGQVKALVWDACQGKCAYCGKLMNPFRDFTLDHRLPKAQGGDLGIGNLVGCCRSCNSRKGARTLAEWK